MTGLVLLAWLFPFVEASLLVHGLRRARRRRPGPGDGGATEAVIQITTIGNHTTVNWILEQVRAYQLPFSHRLWVVVEPWTAPGFVGADEVIVVPAEFSCQATHKARAQEWSRRVRAERGFNRRDVKIIMLDDDTLPTRQYLIDAFNADYDVCEGITSPRIGYGRWFSHMDNMRTASCMVVCSTFQGHGHPIWVHGEGLTIRGTAEETVTWDYPIIASEDLVFGHNAVGLGLSWGFLWEYVQLTSPWSWKDFLKQRRRWLWGNIHALRNGLIPPLGGALVASRYVMGVLVFLLSTSGALLVPAGVAHVPGVLLRPFLASVGIWLASYAFACWVSTGRKEKAFPLRVRDAATGVLLAPVTGAVTVAVVVTALVMGAPTKFEVIQKARPGAVVAPAGTAV